MATKKQRIDTTPDAVPLTHSPFAALQISKADGLPAPDHSSPPEPAHATENPEVHIERTRKGGLPIRLENRAKGKVVTVIGNITGDAEGLLRQLKKHCGAGGVIRENTIEIQGDHRNRVESLLSLETTLDLPDSSTKKRP